MFVSRCFGFINEFKKELVDQYRKKYPDDKMDDIFQQSDSDNESETP